MHGGTVYILVSMEQNLADHSVGENVNKFRFCLFLRQVD